MTDSSQKFIARNRAPRVQIEYDIELYGSRKKVRLPFVMGVMSDLAGKSLAPQPALEDRHFLEIDVDNFDARMRAMQPRAAFTVPNTLTGKGNLSVDLTFESIDDFSPAAIARKIAPLRELLEARTQLSDLMAYMDGKSGAEALLEKILSDTAILGAIAGGDGAGAADTDAVLAGLRDLAPTASDQTDSTDDVLDALRTAPVAGAPRTDKTADVLASLANAAPADTDDMGRDAVADALASLEKPAPEGAQPADNVDDILSGIASVAQGPGADTVTDALKSLAATVDDPPGQTDDTDAVLAGIESTAPEADETTLDDTLSTLAENAPQEVPETDVTDDILAGIEAADRPPSHDATDDVLAGLDAVEGAAQADDTDDILAGIEAVEETARDTGLDDALDALADLTVRDAAEPDDTDDILGGLQTVDDPVPEAATDDILAALETPEDDSQDDASDDILADLAQDSAATPVADDLNDVLAGLGADGTDAPDDGDDLDSLLDDLDLGDDADSDGDADLDGLLDDLGLEDDSADDADGAGDNAENTDTDGDLDALLGDLGLEDDAPDSNDAPDGDDIDLDALLDDLGDVDAEIPDMPEQAAADRPRLSSDADFSFGTVSDARPDTARLTRKRFRIAILGDFSGRAARGAIEIGDQLAARRAIALDPDTVEDVIAGFATTLVLPVGKDGAGIEVRLENLDDLHPDELFEKVELFAGLAALKGQLSTGATAQSAQIQLQAWSAAFGTPIAPMHSRSFGASVPADRRLSDFQTLIGDSENRLATASPLDDLLARIVGPHIRAAPDADVTAMQAAIDDALSAAMRLVLHHPEFQNIEAQWRSLDLIARRIEDDDSLDVVLYDVSAEEIGADLAAADDLSQSGLMRLLSDEAMDEEAGRGGYSAFIGLYGFEETPPHAELLGRIGRIAAHLDAPLFTAISPAFLDVEKKDRHPLVAKAWDELRAMPEAGHLGIVTPRFLLRRPYGAKSEPIYEFAFEEFTMQAGLGGMLWANPAVLVAILLAQSFRQNGAGMALGSVMSLGEMPYHYVNDRYGDQVALPCTERNLTTARVEAAVTRGFMPVVSIKGRDVIRLASFQSLAGAEILGPWTGVAPPPPSPPKPAPPPPDPEAGDGADTDLDDLLDDIALDSGVSGDDIGLGDDDAGDDLDLDDLLAEFGDEIGGDTGADSGDDDAENTDDDIDAELAALLEDL